MTDRTRHTRTCELENSGAAAMHLAAEAILVLQVIQSNSMLHSYFQHRQTDNPVIPTDLTAAALTVHSRRRSRFPVPRTEVPRLYVEMEC